MSKAEIAEAISFAEAWERLFNALPRDEQNEILCQPYGQSAADLAAQANQFAELGVA